MKEIAILCIENLGKLWIVGQSAGHVDRRIDIVDEDKLERQACSGLVKRWHGFLEHTKAESC